MRARIEDLQVARWRVDTTRGVALAEGFDVLGHVVERARAPGLAVHAWVPVLSAYHHAYDELPRPERWVWTEHGPDAPTADRRFTATRPVRRYHQDWAAWAADGRLDALFPMVYLDQRTHAGWFDQWSGFLDRFAGEVDPLLVGGQAAYLNSPENSLAQLDRLRAGADGVAVYSYQQTSDTGTSQELLDHLVTGPWRHTAPVPAPLRR